jgi:Na+/H+ antiporter NhaB
MDKLMARRDKNVAQGFFKVYYRLSKQDRTNRENYEMTERVFKKRTGKRCFKNFDSFRRSQEYHYNKE